MANENPYDPSWLVMTRIYGQAYAEHACEAYQDLSVETAQWWSAMNEPWHTLALPLVGARMLGNIGLSALAPPAEFILEGAFALLGVDDDLGIVDRIDELVEERAERILASDD